MGYKEISEEEAIQDFINQINNFKSKHGKSALQSAIEHGAFHVHTDYGDLTYVFKDREYNHDYIDIPVWIIDMYAIATEEDAL